MAIKDLKLIRDTAFGIKYRRWSFLEVFFFVLKEAIYKVYFYGHKFYCYTLSPYMFVRRWRKGKKNARYFDFNGIKFPDVPTRHDLNILMAVFDDSFLSWCFFNDRYDRPFVEYIDKHLKEGLYGYVDGAFDVTVKEGDVVIDAGAWGGDFSAYSAVKGATCYAFEPAEQIYRFLCTTAQLYPQAIHPVQMGLAEKPQEASIVIAEGVLDSSGSILAKKGDHSKEEKITLTSLDHFAEAHHLTKIDFIKADIEGAERDMLRGATHVLKTFAPKLAICTYHLPDDPQVLEQIIREANPNYTVVHLRHKLFAAVIPQPS
jgi:FkbM family methyltransferase